MESNNSPSPIIAYTNDQLVSPRLDTTPPLQDFTRIGNRLFWLDGSVILNGRVVTNATDLACSLPEAFAFWSPQRMADWWAKSAKNVGALYAQDTTENWSACYPDPLGGAIAFYIRHAGHTVISTDINQITKFYKGNKKPLEKNTLFQVERIVFGNGGLNKSSFKNVKSAEPFQYILVNSGNVQVNNYSIFDDLNSLSHDALFRQLREDVLSSVNAILDHSSQQKIAHVTGGFDSRLVLSAMQSLGRTSEALFFCSGPEGTTDRQVADSLTTEYNLRRVAGAGLTPSPTGLMAEKLLGPLFSSGGLTSSGPVGREKKVPVSAVGGGYGEVLRTFYGQRPVANELGELDRNVVRKSYLDVTSQAPSNISKTALAELENLLWSEFQNLNGQYGFVDFVGDAHYTHSRNRYHIGQNSLLWSRVGSRFDPLYSVAGFALSASVPQTVRSANTVGFDLMNSFDRSLLEHKFDHDRFNEHLLKMRRRPQQRELSRPNEALDFETALVPDHAATSEFLGVLSKLKADTPQFTSKERQALVEESNKMGVNFWQLLNKKAGQDLLRASHENNSDPSIFDFFDERYIENLYTQKSLNRQELRDLYNIGGIITWLSFG